jgi:exodeoxyribonuclease VII large subunit
VVRRASAADAALDRAMQGLLRRRRERLDRTADRVANAVMHRLGQSRQRLTTIRTALPASFERQVRGPRERWAAVAGRLEPAMQRRLSRLAARLDQGAATLDALSPLAVLGRGYAMARDGNGRILRRTADFTPGQAFTLRVSDGEIPARMEER